MQHPSAQHSAQPSPKGEVLVAHLAPEALGFTPSKIWNPSPSTSHRRDPYPLPKSLRVGVFGNPETGAKFSPPPFAVVVEDDDGRRSLVSVRADAGWHLWNQIDFHASPEGVRVEIDLEGHSDPADVCQHVKVEVFRGEQDESRHELLARGLAAQYPEAEADGAEHPDWWHRPIYCGWGDQVAYAMWLEGIGPETRALAYCLQGLYERWIARLDEAGVPFGTTIIDAGWSPTGVWELDETRWPDLKGFIAREHARGRKVLLWVGTWLWDGLPDEQCVFAGGRKLTADPTSPSYLADLRRRVSWLLSPEGLDADGFKVDQLAYVPCQRRPRGGSRFGWTRYSDEPAEPIRPHGPGWGVELLYRYQKEIYDAAKQAKPDALITSSTVHPYFHDTFDMVRLHDTGEVVGDVIVAMKARSDLARAALPNMPIDADDWVHSNYERWMDYTQRSSALGVPCIFYSERFVLNWHSEPATMPIPLDDLRAIAEAWNRAVLPQV